MRLLVQNSCKLVSDSSGWLRPMWCRAAGVAVASVTCFVWPVLFSQRVTAADAGPQRCAISRVFFQDPDKLTLMWADLLAQDPPVLTAAMPVDSFPVLDPERQSLVQMSSSDGKIMIGVRDNEDGDYQSGWVLVDSGVQEEEHGDHSHWYYTARPRVLSSRLDESQGNPAHLYCYDGVFYLANDRIGGFTRLDPSMIPPQADPSLILAMAAFHAGGAGHITLAVAGDVAYSTWMSRDEATAKRIDVTALSEAGTKEIAYSFDVHSGGLHGATYQSGKVFFAPADGIDWLTVPPSPKTKSSDMVVHHIDLGSDQEKPLRTGAFTPFADHVLFLSGSGAKSFLGLIDARRDLPELTRVSLELDSRSKAHGPAIVQTRSQGPLAFVFHDHLKDVDAPNLATVVQLDPNRDGDFSDAKVRGQFDIGRSQVEGHSGHHDIAFDASGRYGVIVNPGDQSVQIVSTSDLSTLSTIDMPFKPNRVLTIGGRGPIEN